jgi:hypothetical protein
MNRRATVGSRAAALLLGLAASSCLAGGPWPDFRAIVWQPQSPAACAALKEAGIDAGAVIPNRERPARGFDESIAPLKDCGLSWFVENIATDFYSAYHRYTEGKPVNWRFVEVKKAYRAGDPGALLRDPGLSDPQWQERIRGRLAETVRLHRAYRPLYYALADEPGIADLSAFWDFDFSPQSLAGLRAWLRQRYGTLAALNAQWGSRFADWDSVVPMTTAQAMQRPDGNYSAWADFKEWMDEAFARAVALGTQAIHAADPGAYSAIEGGQVPGWGGYDYSRLAGAVDVLELYDGGGNVEIARSLNPGLVLLRTSFNEGAAEAHGLWRSLLRGARGAIFWDPQQRIAGEDGRAGERGRALAPQLREIKRLAPLLIRSRRQVAPVGIVYSPASMRAQWMLDWRPKGSAWSDRGPGEVYEDASAVRTSMTYFLDALARAGLEPRILTPDMIGRGALARGIRVLILPRTLALSAREAERIRSFAALGGTVIADGAVPGSFDEHCRQLERPRLADLFRSATAVTRAGKGKAYLFGSPSARYPFMTVLADAGVVPLFALSRKDGGRATDVEAYLWQDAGKTIVGLQRELSEVAPEPLTLTLREPARVVDLRQRRDLGMVESLELTLDPVVPVLLSLSGR